jgi:drug/metabolite transporter (DMT)-like permease
VHSVLLLLVAVVWGSTFVVIKDSTRHVDPYFLVFSRLAIAAAAMAGWCAWRDRAALRHRAAIGYGALLGLLLFGTYASQTVGLQWTTSGHSGFITGSAVVLVPLLMRFLFRAPLGRADALASVLVLAGLYLLVYDRAVSVNRGDLITVLAALSYAFHLVFGARAVRAAPVSGVVTWQFLFAALFAGVAFLAAGGQPCSEPARAWLPILYLGLVGTLFCYFVSVWAQRFVSPVTVVILFSLEAVFAALFGCLLRGEHLAPRELAGAALIFGSVVGHEVLRVRARAR